VSQSPALRHQTLGRSLSASEDNLANHLMAIFASTHDWEQVAAKLNERAAERPSGEAAPWTVPALEQELELINRSLDKAYAEAGIGA
jgi:hypothetical protein